MVRFAFIIEQKKKKKKFFEKKKKNFPSQKNFLYKKIKKFLAQNHGKHQRNRFQGGGPKLRRGGPIWCRGQNSRHFKIAKSISKRFSVDFSKKKKVFGGKKT